jgi:iron complex transport system substrate-binding protein
MKKVFFQLLLAFSILTLILAGCGANNAGSNKGTDTPKNDETAKTEETTEYTVVHAMGETVMEETPQKVVVLTNEGTEAVLELGVKPVGAASPSVGTEWYSHIKEEMEGVTELGEESAPNLETIAGLQPDLIIGNKIRHEEIYEQLSAIAPTVFSEDLAGDWKQNFELYAKALNKEAEGKEAMARYDAHVGEVQENLSDKLDMKVSVVRFLPTTVRIYQKDTFAGTILSDLGIARPESQDVDNFMEVITEEQMDSMDGDVMFYFNADYDDEKGGTKMQEAWMQHPLYEKLNVAQTDSAYKVDEIIWNLSGGIKAANLLLDDIMKHMEEM